MHSKGGKPRSNDPLSGLRPLKVSRTALELARKYGYLPYMIERYLKMLGLDETIKFLQAVEEGLPGSIRCNTLTIRECKLLPSTLKKHGIKLRAHEYLPHAFIVEEGREKVGHTNEYMMGFYYVQGLASMLAPLLLSPKSGEVVADLAAAPGGKTTYLAQLMENKGIITAVDNSFRRIKALINNIQRMRVVNTVVVRDDIKNFSKKFSETFDRVLLDAPCTAEGLLPLKRERKTSTTYDEIVRMCSVQTSLLIDAVDLLKKGGVLLYTTCSIAPEENEAVITYLLQKREDVEILETRWNNIGRPGIVSYGDQVFSEDVRKCLRVFPHSDRMEGFFYCLIKRK